MYDNLTPKIYWIDDNMNNASFVSPEEAHELSSSTPIEFLKLNIQTDSDPIVQRFCAQKQTSFLNDEWSHVPFFISGLGSKSGGEKTRPTLVLPNPEGIYSYYIQNGFLDFARISYYLAHPSLLPNTGFEVHQFFVSRITEVNSRMIKCQISSLSDGNRFKLPSRRFVQPEFNQVRL